MIWIKKIKLQSSDTRALILSTEMMKKFSIKRNKPKPSLSVISRLLFHQQQTLRTPPPLSSSFLAPDSSSLFSFLFCNFFSFSSLLHHPPLFDPLLLLLFFSFLSLSLILLHQPLSPLFFKHFNSHQSLLDSSPFISSPPLLFSSSSSPHFFFYFKHSHLPSQIYSPLLLYSFFFSLL